MSFLDNALAESPAPSLSENHSFLDNKKSFVLHYNIAGLHFEYEQKIDEIEVRCQLHASGQKFVVAKLNRKIHTVDIDDFMWGQQFDDKYVKFYANAKAILKKNGRTFSGVVMEVIKKSLGNDDFIKVSCNVWNTSRGYFSITSSGIKEVATKLLQEKHLNMYEQKICDYMKYRYKQLHPSEDVNWNEHLKNLSVSGWYGAWLPREDNVPKKDIIETKTKFI